jgi:hypothetical protein
MASVDSIASCTRSCILLFQQLRGILETTELDDECQLVPGVVNIQSSRFDLWSRNIAALHPAHLPSSLEHRLRDDEDGREIVKNALKYLEESLEISQFTFPNIFDKAENLISIIDCFRREAE